MSALYILVLTYLIISPSISTYSLSALQFLFPLHLLLLILAIIITWSKVSKRDLDNYKDMVSQCLPTLPSDVLNCSSTDCTHHMESLDNYAHQFISIVMIVASVVFLATHVRLLITLLTGKMVLVNSKRQLISGIRYG